MIYATESDLERLTDYKSPAKQIEYLTRQNIPFAISRAGKPLILIEVLKQMSEKNQAKPNFKTLESYSYSA